MPCLLGKMLIALQSLICASKINNQQNTGCAANPSNQPNNSKNNFSATPCAPDSGGNKNCAINNSGTGMNNIFLILGIVLACLYVKKMKSKPKRGGRRTNNYYGDEYNPRMPSSSRCRNRRYNRRHDCDREYYYRNIKEKDDQCIINQMFGNCTPTAGCLIKTLFILKCLTMC